MSDYKLVRLVTGEEIVGEISESMQGDEITIIGGHVLISAGEGKIGMMPFMPYTNAKVGVTVKTQHVVFIVDPVSDLAEQVRQMANPHSIITPSKGIIV